VGDAGRLTRAGSGRGALGDGLGERATRDVSLRLGCGLQVGGDIGELVERGIHSHERELALHDGEVEAPHVLEHAAEPAGRVVQPSLGVPSP